MKDQLGGQILKKFVGLRAKRNSYLKVNNDEDKKAKWCLKASQIENKITYLEKKKKIDVDFLKEDKKEFIKNKLLKTQQRF